MNLKILILGASLTALATGAAIAADAPAAHPDQRTEERIVIICDGGPGGPHGPGGPGGEHGAMEAEMHGKLDANGDGAITRDEFRAMHDEMFGKMDKNHDGKLSGDEMGHHGGPDGPGERHVEVIVDGPEGHGDHGPGGPGMHGCGPGGPGGDMAWTGEGGDNVRIIRHGPGGPDGHDGPGDLDANKDGKVSFEEFVGPMREHFNAVDKNHNGFLDGDEMGGDHVFMFRREDHH